MIRVEASVEGERIGVEVEVKADMGDAFVEAQACVRALYEAVCGEDVDARVQFLSALAHLGHALADEVFNGEDGGLYA